MHEMQSIPNHQYHVPESVMVEAILKNQNIELVEGRLPTPTYYRFARHLKFILSGEKIPIPKRHYTAQEDEEIIRHIKTDRQLAKKMSRTMKAISAERCRAKKRLASGKNRV